MDTYYSIEIIKDFFFSLGYNWTGYYFDEETTKVKLANVENFKNCKPITLIFYNQSLKLTDDVIVLSNFKFSIFSENAETGELIHERNLDKLWCKFLINKFGHDYAKDLYSWIAYKMVDIK